MRYISPYLFLELALLLFLLGFGWEQWKLRDVFSRWFLLTALGLAVLGFAMDQVAIHLGLWTYTNSGVFKVQVFSMPIEEYCLFFLHSLFCLIFVRHYSTEEQSPRDHIAGTSSPSRSSRSGFHIGLRIETDAVEDCCWQHELRCY